MEVKLKMPFFLLPFSELKGYRLAGYDGVGHCGTNGSNIYEF